jgi:dihydroflavonol-4-reductase
VSLYLVTGATGCVGSNLTLELIRRGHRVRALIRPGSATLAVADLGCERWTGDVRQPDTVRTAVHGCDGVFHCAGIVSFWKKRREEQIQTNVHGTRAVVEACLAEGVPRMVHTSSVAALGYRTDGGLIDESTAYNWGSALSYRYTKYMAELAVLEGVRQGLEAVIVNPTVVIGPRDIHFHGGQIVRDIGRGRVPAYIGGGMNIVSARDVAEGHIAAMERGRAGERYILGGVNLTHKDIFALCARVLQGRARAPWLRLPAAVAKAIARGLDVLGDMTGREPWITPDLLSSAGMLNWYSIEKARLELLYNPTPVEDAIREAHQWYRENTLL